MLSVIRQDAARMTDIQEQAGRNRLCPCGSTKKYKLCCEERDRGAAALPPGDTSASLAILVPIRDTLTVPTRYALTHHLGMPARILYEVGLPVDIARNRLARRARETEGISHILWCDADAFWTRQSMDALRSAAASAAPMDIVGALHSSRGPNLPPNASWSLQRYSATHLQLEEYTELDVLEVGFVGSHLWWHSRVLLDALGEDPWTVADGDASEDFAFCRRVTELCGTVYLAARCEALHFDADVGYAFLPHRDAVRITSDGAIVDGPGWVRTSWVTRFRSYGPTVDAARRRGMIAAIGVDPEQVMALQREGRYDAAARLFLRMRSI
jgi:hypothetical protein